MVMISLCICCFNLNEIREYFTECMDGFNELSDLHVGLNLKTDSPLPSFPFPFAPAIIPFYSAPAIHHWLSAGSLSPQPETVKKIQGLAPAII